MHTISHVEMLRSKYKRLRFKTNIFKVTERWKFPIHSNNPNFKMSKTLRNENRTKVGQWSNI